MTVTSAGVSRGKFAFSYVCPQLASTGSASVPIKAGGSLLILAGLGVLALRPVLRRVRPARA